MAQLKHPDCPFDAEVCRVSKSHSVVPPRVAWQPIYDGAGRLMNTDPNTFLDDYSCAVCGGQWQEQRAGGVSNVRVIRPAQQQPPAQLPT